MKEKLINYFNNHKKIVNIFDIIKELKVKEDEYSLLLFSLYELMCEGIIFSENNKEFMHMPKDFIYKVGKVNLSSKGNKYIDLLNGNIVLIDNKSGKDIKIGDYVLFEAMKTDVNKHQFNANIKNIIKIPSLTMNYLSHGVIEKDYNKNYFYVNIGNNRIYILPHELNGAFVGDTVNVRIYHNELGKFAKVDSVLKRKQEKHLFKVKILNDKLVAYSINSKNIIYNIPDSSKVGDILVYDINEYGNYVFVRTIEGLTEEIKLYAEEYGFPTDFDEKTLKEAEKINLEIDKEEIDKRVDLRNLITFTIDGEHSKDLDDAVSIEKVGENYVLYVSIADVSYYIKKGTSLFNSAATRQTSIYPLDRVIPMLPFKISNGICSLNEGVDRLAKTVKMEIDSNGNVLNYDIFNSVIRSNKKMSYGKVNALLNNEIKDETYLPYCENLKIMNELSIILQRKRMQRGFICFNIDEYEFEMDKYGNIKNISIRERGPAQILIENFMVTTNEVVAEYITYLGLKCSYRCHPSPNIDQLYKLKKKLSSISKYLHTLRNADNPKLLQNILVNICKTKGNEEGKAISKIMLSSMPRAYYSTNNIGHYGLALNYYATFTSPIRRFPDIINHMIVENIISGNYDEALKNMSEYEKLCVYGSEISYSAQVFEKNIESMMLSKYLSNIADEEMDALVVFISEEYLYIKTQKNGICGIIPLDDNIIENYNIKIGDTIKVKYKYVTEKYNDVEFSLVKKEKTKKIKKK